MRVVNWILDFIAIILWECKCVQDSYCLQNSYREYRENRQQELRHMKAWNLVYQAMTKNPDFTPTELLMFLNNEGHQITPDGRIMAIVMLLIEQGRHGWSRSSESVTVCD